MDWMSIVVEGLPAENNASDVLQKSYGMTCEVGTEII